LINHNCDCDSDEHLTKSLLSASNDLTIVEQVGAETPSTLHNVPDELDKTQANELEILAKVAKLRASLIAPHQESLPCEPGTAHDHFVLFSHQHDNDWHNVLGGWRKGTIGGTEEECAWACITHEQCAAFSFRKGDGKCLLRKIAFPSASVTLKQSATWGYNLQKKERDRPNCTWRGRERWPRVMVIGQRKAGSSSLNQALHHVPLLCGASNSDGSSLKETHFFGQHQSQHVSAEKYLQYFDVTTCPVDRGGRFMDNTPIYSMRPAVPTYIKLLYPRDLHNQLRFILVIREPISRLLSQYNHQRTLSFSANEYRFWGGPAVKETLPDWQMSFETYARGLTFQSENHEEAGSNIAEVIKSYQTEFSSRQLLVISMGTLLSQTENAKQAILEFLQLDDMSDWANETFPHTNSKITSHKVSLDAKHCTLLKDLKGYYEADQAEVFRLTSAANSPRMQPSLQPFKSPYDIFRENGIC
jgi:hypothetical protein